MPVSEEGKQQLDCVSKKCTNLARNDKDRF